MLPKNETAADLSLLQAGHSCEEEDKIASRALEHLEKGPRYAQSDAIYWVTGESFASNLPSGNYLLIS